MPSSFDLIHSFFQNVSIGSSKPFLLTLLVVHFWFQNRSVLVLWTVHFQSFGLAIYSLFGPSTTSFLIRLLSVFWVVHFPKSVISSFLPLYRTCFVFWSIQFYTWPSTFSFIDVQFNSHWVHLRVSPNLSPNFSTSFFPIPLHVSEISHYD